jgi:hypothetical protein
VDFLKIQVFFLKILGFLRKKKKDEKLVFIFFLNGNLKFIYEL